MKRLFLLFVGITILIGLESCQPVIIRSVSDFPFNELPLECRNLNEVINRTFFKVNKYNYFILTGELIQEIEKNNYYCIRSLTPDEIKLMFGEPSIETQDVIFYKITNTKPVNGVIWGLVFDKDGKYNIKNVAVKPYKF